MMTNLAPLCKFGPLKCSLYSSTALKAGLNHLPKSILIMKIHQLILRILHPIAVDPLVRRFKLSALNR